MGDFKESDTRCRVHPVLGDPVECRFDDSLKQEILESLMALVRVHGEATVATDTERVLRFDIRSIERLDDGSSELSGSPVGQSFWDAPSLRALAQSQSIGPMKNVESLFGTWPGEEHDGFEEAVSELRRAGPGSAADA